MLKSNQYLYNSFESFVVRTPRYPFSLVEKLDCLPESFKEDIYIASPELYDEILRMGKDLTPKIKKTIYKYWSRACYRSTPFGMFAGCSFGKISDSRSVIISTPENVVRKTRLDTSYLCSLVKHIESINEVRTQLLYYPNDSIIRVGNRLRYIESVDKKNHRNHISQEVDSSKYILKILKEARKGCSISNLANYIVEGEISLIDAKQFVETLVDNQILVSEISVNITGDDALSTLITTLSKKTGIEPLIERLVEIQHVLSSLSGTTVHDETLYGSLYENLNTFPVEYNKKNLLQVDMYRPVVNAEIPFSDIEELQKTISFLNKIKLSENITSSMTEFVKEFEARYEDEEVPFLEAMDSDIGIGYPVGFVSRKDNSFFKDYFINDKGNVSVNRTLSKVESLILKKIIEKGNINTLESIELRDEDIKVEKNKQKESFVPTLSALCQYFRIGERNHLYLKSLGGSSAAFLLGRFGYLSNEISDLITKICDYDQFVAGNNKIVCEIVHLPETRIGNISSRSFSRLREIHYLCRPSVPSRGIPASDLMLSYRRGRLFLRSKYIRNKELTPILSNAHNFNYRSVPAYHFLCDYQFEHNKSIEKFTTENLLDYTGYLPRIIYGNVVLQLRRWLLNADPVFPKKWTNYTPELDESVKSLIVEKSLPNHIVLTEGDNNLYLNLDSTLSRELLCETLIKRRVIMIEEPVNDIETEIVSDGKDSYCSEFIIPFCKNLNYEA